MAKSSRASKVFGASNVLAVNKGSGDDRFLDEGTNHNRKRRRSQYCMIVEGDVDSREAELEQNDSETKLEAEHEK
jgi:hypothetical protein